MRSLLLFSFALAVHAQPPQQFAEIGDLRLESGETIPKCKIGYRTFGQLNAGRSNAVLFPTWFGGNSESLVPLIGPGKIVDSSRYFVIAVDALGNGVSSSPSNGPQPFPKFTIRDMVRSQHTLLTGHLKLTHLHAVVGISMGGMQTFQWMISYPEFFDRAVPIVGTPQLSSMDLLLWQTELTAIEESGDPQRAMRTVSRIHQLALFTPEYRHEQTPHAAFTDFSKTLDSGRTLAPQDWASQLRAMMSHDIAKDAGGALEKVSGSVRARTLVIVASQDHMVNPLPALRFARIIGARVLELTGNCGHMAVTCEGGQIYQAASRFLAESL